jgi:uncharacterized membrane protein YgcG
MEGRSVKRALCILALVAPALIGLPAGGDPLDSDDLHTFTVLQVDPATNEVRVQETGSTRIRTLELDDRSRISGGALGGRMGLRDLQPGDTIRAPGVIGSSSDRVRAEEISVLPAPRDPDEVVPRRRELRGEPTTGPSSVDPETEEPGRDTAPGALGPGPPDPDLIDPPGIPGTEDPTAGPGPKRGTGAGRDSRSGTGSQGAPGTGGGGGSGGGGGDGGGP